MKDLQGIFDIVKVNPARYGLHRTAQVIQLDIDSHKAYNIDLSYNCNIIINQR